MPAYRQASRSVNHIINHSFNLARVSDVITVGFQAHVLSAFLLEQSILQNFWSRLVSLQLNLEPHQIQVLTLSNGHLNLLSLRFAFGFLTGFFDFPVVFLIISWGYMDLKTFRPLYKLYWKNQECKPHTPVGEKETKKSCKNILGGYIIYYVLVQVLVQVKVYYTPWQGIYKVYIGYI